MIAIEFEYGSVRSVLIRFLMTPMLFCLGVLTVALAFVSAFYEDAGPLERYLGPLLLPAIGLMLIRAAVLSFRGRHAYSTRYVVHERGIDVQPRGEVARLVGWADIDRIVIWRFFQWCEIHAGSLEKPIILSNSKGEISQAEYKAGLRLVTENVSSPAEKRLV